MGLGLGGGMFRYAPRCSAAGCRAAARYKIGAPWSDGAQRELKNYGLACEAHVGGVLRRGRESRARLRVGEGELVGEVGVYELAPGRLNGELRPLEAPEGGWPGE